jgi:hypothetical protein
MRLWERNLSVDTAVPDWYNLIQIIVTCNRIGFAALP